MISIREFNFPQDYLSVRRLWESMEQGIRLGRSDTIEEIQKKITRDPELFLIAESRGDIIGTVMGGFDGRRGLLYHLAIAPNFRNQGLGGKLMEELEKRLHTKGCLKCYLIVTADNDAAMRYYEKRGWENMTSFVRLYGKELE